MVVDIIKIIESKALYLKIQKLIEYFKSKIKFLDPQNKKVGQIKTHKSLFICKINS